MLKKMDIRKSGGVLLVLQRLLRRAKMSHSHWHPDAIKYFLERQIHLQDFEIGNVLREICQLLLDSRYSRWRRIPTFASCLSTNEHWDFR